MKLAQVYWQTTDKQNATFFFFFLVSKLIVGNDCLIMVLYNLNVYTLKHKNNMKQVHSYWTSELICLQFPLKGLVPYSNSFGFAIPWSYLGLKSKDEYDTIDQSFVFHFPDSFAHLAEMKVARDS